MSDEKIRCVLFDLGGVLVEWVGTPALVDLTGGRLSEEEARRFWLESPWVVRFERGQCTPEQFARGAVAELGLSMSPQEFLERFKTWDRGPLPGAWELLDELRGRYLLGCLSNNNALHWDIIRNDFDFGRRFDRCYLSHEIGLAKPDPGIFEYALQDLGLPGHQVFYLDDNPECVEAARRVGLEAELARGVPEARRRLQEAGLL
ncbi:MAG: hypothetical protein Kow00109_29760 [Acidobacteriota bacterium]